MQYRPLDGPLCTGNESAAQSERTPLVLDAYFSTQASNSDLIVFDEISARACLARAGRTTRTRRKTKRDFPTFPIWPTREGTPCHGESSPVVNSLPLQL